MWNNNIYIKINYLTDPVAQKLFSFNFNKLFNPPLLTESSKGSKIGVSRAGLTFFSFITLWYVLPTQEKKKKKSSISWNGSTANR